MLMILDGPAEDPFHVGGSPNKKAGVCTKRRSVAEAAPGAETDAFLFGSLVWTTVNFIVKTRAYRHTLLLHLQRING